MRNIKLLLEYDGTGFVGWQRQARGRSVQGEIERTLEEFLREKVTLIGAGRTDAGVHARGQVANFRTHNAMEIGSMARALDGLLPEDIAVLSAEEVREDFHARFDAKEREYSYLILRRAVALERAYSWRVTYPMDVSLLQQAAQFVRLQTDFEAFSKAGSDVDHYRCTVKTSIWIAEGERLHYVISADRFLYGMVRALVGTMVNIARGYTNIEDLEKIFVSKDRSRAGMAAPAHGLVLEAVRYE